MEYLPYIVSFIGCITGVVALIKQSTKDRAEIKNLDTQTGSILLADALKLKEEVQEQLDFIHIELDENKKELDIVQGLLCIQKKEITLLKGAITRLKKKVLGLREGIDILITQIKNSGGIPAWTPEDVDELD